jgi:hypothetical protein
VENLAVNGVKLQDELPHWKLSPPPIGQLTETSDVPLELPQAQPIERWVTAPPETVMLIDRPWLVVPR